MNPVPTLANNLVPMPSTNPLRIGALEAGAADPRKTVVGLVRSEVLATTASVRFEPRVVLFGGYTLFLQLLVPLWLVRCCSCLITCGI